MRFLHYSDVENAHDDPECVGRVAGIVESLRDEETFVCGTGDNVAPGVLPLVTRGGQALDFFEAVSPTVSTLGNHDFDFGPDRTRELVERSPQEWIVANVYEGDERFADVEPWTLRSVSNGTVGFVGVTDPSTAGSNPEATGLRFTDPVAETREAVAALRARDVDAVVVLSHLGRGDERLATACDVELVLGGHVHSERIVRVADTILTRPGSGGDCVLEVDLADGTVTRHAVDGAPLDESLAARYREHLADAGLDAVVGRVDEPIRRTEREAFRGESRVGNFVADAYRWAAEKQLVYDGDYDNDGGNHCDSDGDSADDSDGDSADDSDGDSADDSDGDDDEAEEGDAGDAPVVALQNSGGIRTGPPLEDEITVADLVSLVPFEEPAVVVELNGAELVEIFREAAVATGFGEADWWHGHVSGASLVYDHTDDELLEARVRGEPVDPDGRYLLATSEFLLYADEEFPTLTDADRYRTLDTQYEILADYARAVGVAPELDGRIVRTGV